MPGTQSGIVKPMLLMAFIALLIKLIAAFIGAFKEYDSVIGLFGVSGGSFDQNTGPRNMTTMVYFIYDQIDKNMVHYASAAAVVLFIIIMIFPKVYMKELCLPNLMANISMNMSKKLATVLKEFKLCE